MFHPMATTVVLALLSAMLLSVTLVHCVCGHVLSRARKNPLRPMLDGLRRLYRPLLIMALRLRYLVLAAAILIVSGSVWLGSRLGTEFVPTLDEGDITMHALRIPGTSLSQAVAMQTELEKIVATLRRWNPGFLPHRFR